MLIKQKHFQVFFAETCCKTDANTFYRLAVE